MMVDKNKRISKNELDKIIPPKDKEEAIAQSEKYIIEFEKNRERINQIYEELQKMFEDLDKLK